MDPARPRILRREWKRNKTHLPRSDSLPVLQLIPLDRPLFLCRRCGFSNASGMPICLWCAWNSAESARAFEQSLPRGRRISAPPRVVSPATLSRYAKKEAEENRNRELLRGTYVSVATVTTISRAVHSKSKSLGDNYLNAPARARHKHSHSVDRTMHAPTPSLAKITHTHLAPIHGSPGRVLRRQKHRTQLRQKSPRSTCASALPFPSPERPLTASAQSCTVTEPAVPIFRLGHPMRPYYSAIRPNMSPPSSPCDYSYSSRLSANVPAFSIPRVSMTSLESSPDLSPHRESLKFPPPTGCSLSGEAELRIALAEQSGNIDEEYKFLKLERGANRRRGVRGKVRQLSRDIKDFVFGAAPRLQL